MHALQIWTAAARPKTLAAGIAPVLLGTMLASAVSSFLLSTFILTLLTALGIQISANFANDYFDFLKGADTSERKGPLRVTQAGLVSPDAMKKGLFFSLGATAVIGCFLVVQGGFLIALPLALSLVLAVAYTGGPYPLAYLGLGDLFVFIFFGPVAVAGTYFLQTGILSWIPVVAGLAPGALSSAILCVNNVRDVKEDVKANKKTLVVRFGATFGKIQYVACFVTASIVPFFFVATHPFVLISLLFLLPALPVLRVFFFHSDPRDLNEVLTTTGQLLLIYISLFCIGFLM